MMGRSDGKKDVLELSNHTHQRIGHEGFGSQRTNDKETLGIAKARGPSDRDLGTERESRAR